MLNFRLVQFQPKCLNCFDSDGKTIFVINGKQELDNTEGSTQKRKTMILVSYVA